MNDQRVPATLTRKVMICAQNGHWLLAIPVVRYPKANIRVSDARSAFYSQTGSLCGKASELSKSKLPSLVGFNVQTEKDANQKGNDGNKSSNFEVRNHDVLLQNYWMRDL